MQQKKLVTQHGQLDQRSLGHNHRPAAGTAKRAKRAGTLLLLTLAAVIPLMRSVHIYMIYEHCTRSLVATASTEDKGHALYVLTRDECGRTHDVL